MAGIELIYGPMLIGVFFNCMLFGVMVMQLFIYYQTYTKDSSWIRLFIFYLFVIETVNTCCDIYLIYQPLVQQFGTLAAVTYFPMMLAASPIVTVCVSTPVQIFTAWRIRVVSQSIKIPILICLLSLVSCVGGIWVGVNVITLKLFARKLSFEFNRPGVVWFVASALADVLITTTLVFSLSTRRTGHATTNLSVNRIIRLTIQTGLTTMVFALADLLFFTISPKTAISFVWDFSISKLYTNALLSTLNARVGWGNINASDQDPENVLFGDESKQIAAQPSNTYLNSSSVHNVRIAAGTTSGASTGSYELQPAKFKGDGSDVSNLKHIVRDPSYSQDDASQTATQ